MNKLLFLFGLMFAAGCHDINSSNGDGGSGGEGGAPSTSQMAPEFTSGQGQPLNVPGTTSSSSTQTESCVVVGHFYCAGACCDPEEDPLDCISTSDTHCCTADQFCLPKG